MAENEIKKKYKCDDCGRYYYDNSTLTRHVKSKTCVNKKNARTCKICNTSYANKQYMTKHLTTDKHKKKEASMNIIDNPEIKEKYDIVPFGREKIKKFYGEEGLKKLSATHFIIGFEIICKLTKKINLDPKIPKYHNVIITEPHSEKGQIYKNNEWITVKIKDITKSILVKRRDDLKYLYEYFEKKEMIDTDLKGKPNWFIQEFNKVVDKELSNYKENRYKMLRKFYMEKLKNLIYEHRNMLLKTKNTMNIKNK